MYCKKCGNFVEDGQKECPNCHEPMTEDKPKKKSVAQKWWFWVLMGFATLIMFYVIRDLEAERANPTDTTGQSGIIETTEPTDTTAEPKVEYIEITAAELYAAYDENEIAADAKYTGKMLKITGIVDDISKDILDRVYITLKTNELFNSIQCYFVSSSAIEAVAQLKEGDEVVVVGKCKGKNVFNVDIEDCEIQ